MGRPRPANNSGRGCYSCLSPICIIFHAYAPHPAKPEHPSVLALRSTPICRLQPGQPHTRSQLSRQVPLADTEPPHPLMVPQKKGTRSRQPLATVLLQHAPIPPGPGPSPLTCTNPRAGTSLGARSPRLYLLWRHRRDLHRRNPPPLRSCPRSPSSPRETPPPRDDRLSKPSTPQPTSDLATMAIATRSKQAKEKPASQTDTAATLSPFKHHQERQSARLSKSPHNTSVNPLIAELNQTGARFDNVLEALRPAVHGSHQRNEAYPTGLLDDSPELPSKHPLTANKQKQITLQASPTGVEAPPGDDPDPPANKDPAPTATGSETPTQARVCINKVAGTADTSSSPGPPRHGSGNGRQKINPPAGNQRHQRQLQHLHLQ